MTSSTSPAPASCTISKPTSRLSQKAPTYPSSTFSPQPSTPTVAIVYSTWQAPTDTMVRLITPLFPAFSSNLTILPLCRNAKIPPLSPSRTFPIPQSRRFKHHQRAKLVRQHASALGLPEWTSRSRQSPCSSGRRSGTGEQGESRCGV